MASFATPPRSPPPPSPCGMSHAHTRTRQRLARLLCLTGPRTNTPICQSGPQPPSLLRQFTNNASRTLALHTHCYTSRLARDPRRNLCEAGMAEQTVAGPKSSKGAPLKGAKKGNGAAKPRPKIFRRYSNAPPEPSPFPSFPALPSLESLVASPPLSFSHLCTLGLLLFILHKLTTMMSTLFRGAAVTTPSIIEHGTWMKVGKTSKSSTVMYTPLQNRVNEGGLLSTPPRRSSYSTSTTISASPGTGINPATAAASWVFFSPAKPPQPSKFIDYTDSPSKSVAALSGVNGIARDPYTSSKLMRKNLLSLIPLERQGGLHEALTRVYMTACDKEHTIAGREVRLRSDKSRYEPLRAIRAIRAIATLTVRSQVDDAHIVRGV